MLKNHCCYKLNDSLKLQFVNRNCFIKLDESNYFVLQTLIDEYDKNYHLSSINLLTWIHYGFIVYFYLTQADELVLVYEKQQINKPSYFGILDILFKKERNNYLNRQIIHSIIDQIRSNFNFFTNEMGYATLSPIENDELISNYSLNYIHNAAYIYETNKLKFLAGKKMQKKRNSLNRFIKEFGHVIRVEKFDLKNIRQIRQFLIANSIDSTTLEPRVSEINAFDTLIRLNKQHIGIVVYNKQNQIIGFNLGFITNDYFEVFVQKANKQYTGIMPYLFSETIKRFDLNTKYINLQDDAGEMNLRKNKLSYHPDKLVQTYFYSIKV